MVYKLAPPLINEIIVDFYRVLSSIYCRSYNTFNVCTLKGQLYVFLHDVEWMWSAKKGFHFDVDWFSSGLLYGLIWTGLTELASTWRHWEAHQATPSLITTNNSEQASFAKSRLWARFVVIWTSSVIMRKLSDNNSEQSHACEQAL